MNNAKKLFIVLLATILMAVGLGPSAAMAKPGDYSRVSGGTASQTSMEAAENAEAHVVTGVDLHDGMLLKHDGLYYLYGTQYACGFRWGVTTPTNFCGFGVATSASLDGPWSPITTLFDPMSIDPWNGRTWVDQCTRLNNKGCFNPRMVQRYDGVWILVFNSPADYSENKANAYNFMGCAGPLGPCGPGSGPNGSYNKPAMYICSANGDFGIYTDGADAYIACTLPGTIGISVEKLNKWWTGGAGTGEGERDIAGFDTVEGPGAYFDTSSGKWVMTVNYKNCGYGSGCGLAYATAPTPAGPWTTPENWGFSVDSKARATISWNSCGGQPRTVSVLDSVPYQIVDLWVPGTAGDSRNQKDAGLLITPLVFKNPANTPGVPWQPFENIDCGV